jgi:tRNA(Arg) A34 adenosine deaminase TadA
MSIPALLELASEACEPGQDRLRRAFVGCVAVRGDGTVIRSRNGSAKRPTASCHAEARAMRKAGYGSDVYVARQLKNGQLAMAKPCGRCMAVLRSKGVKLVVYTTGSSTYEIVRL